MKARIFISPKEGILDPQGVAVLNALTNLGFKGINNVRVGKYIEIGIEDGSDIEDQVRRMCEDLLHNPLIESYRFELTEE